MKKDKAVFVPVVDSKVKDELAAVEAIFLWLKPYGGRVRQRILDYVRDMLIYTEEKP